MKNLKNSKYSVGDKVRFMHSGEIVEGMIFVDNGDSAIDFKGEVTYDIMADNPKMLYKHIRETSICK